MPRARQALRCRPVIRPRYCMSCPVLKIGCSWFAVVFAVVYLHSNKTHVSLRQCCDSGAHASIPPCGRRGGGVSGTLCTLLARSISPRLACAACCLFRLKLASFTPTPTIGLAFALASKVGSRVRHSRRRPPAIDTPSSLRRCRGVARRRCAALGCSIVTICDVLSRTR